MPKDPVARDPIDVEVGRVLRAGRLTAGLTQHQLASAVGVSWQQIYKYEVGKDRMPVSRLMAAARALDCPPSALLPAVSGAVEPLNLPEDTGEARQLLSAFVALDTELARSLSLVCRKLAELD